ncbi:Oxidoreductase sirO [Fusarium oxysporum f. sp. albedinis]|nr:Oxidoreductase sirO [Fusarium oxysporum f. sp. albedinis]
MRCTSSLQNNLPVDQLTFHVSSNIPLSATALREVTRPTWLSVALSVLKGIEVDGRDAPPRSLGSHLIQLGLALENQLTTDKCLALSSCFLSTRPLSRLIKKIIRFDCHAGDGKQ